MKEMIYSPDRKIEVLDTGYCLGFLYFILNLGTHPTAYIKIPENHKYYGKNYMEIELPVHGGLTYSENHIYVSENEKVEGWFIGWDYAHYNDYAGYYKKRDGSLYNLKRWTTEEIFKELREVCYRLNEIKE